MKYWKYLIPILIILLCSGQSCETEDTSGQGYYKFTGDQSIIADFLEFAPVSSPVDTYRSDEEIDIIIEVINKMPFDIEEGKVRLRLTGDAAIPTFFSGAKEATAQELPGIEPETGLENPIEVELGPITYLQDISTTVEKEITGEYCYEVPVVVKANLFYTDKEAEIGNNLPVGSNPPSSVQVIDLTQGVVSVDKDTQEGTLKFRITVKNIGQGTVVDSLDDCFFYRDSSHRETLNMNVRGAYDISCDEDVRLGRETQEKTILCEATGIDASNLGPQASELTILLDNFAYVDEFNPVMIYIEP